MGCTGFCPCIRYPWLVSSVRARAASVGFGVDILAGRCPLLGFFFFFPVPSEFSLVQDRFDFDGLRAQTALPSPFLA